MIQIQNVSFDRAGKNILDVTELTLEAKQTIALIGPNGAGKSTLLSLMARLLPLQTGQIRYDYLDISSTSSRVMARKVGILQQHSHFMSRLTVQDLLLYARYPYHKGRPTADDHKVVEQMLAYFELLTFRTTFLDELSGGQRQMALVAMVFCQGTDYILLDEPLNNLDMYHARHLMTTLRRAIVDWNKTIVVVLHDINYASLYADQIVALKQGRIVFKGPPDQVLTPDSIKALYGVEVDIIEHQGKRLSLHF
ncbi:ABC transporter ATP-binding protein [Marinomonas aquiplantarum]|uniref:Iron complex transport system ATP-binding protein n=1 Tax=Marinomonas aquiplantarum TaxID=491951 RepID=A0A366CT20_9GAMM|nr:ATP-binding cassette domain-containing protein [Marinomonas aquiplantarum]RBO78511.1 iron complex transport system ATP-binding protein [Marinomonas aquiplantarum]